MNLTQFEGDVFKFNKLFDSKCHTYFEQIFNLKIEELENSIKKE